MAKSLAFWMEGRKTDKTFIELHINYWLLQHKGGKDFSCIDFGVKFRDLGEVESINFYLPFKVSKDNYYSRLGELICSRKDLIQTIFNSRHKSTVSTSNTSVDINFEGDGDDDIRFFTQISHSPENGGVRISEVDDGSIITFPTVLFKPRDDSGENKLDDRPGYFRFRVALNSQDKSMLSTSYKHTDRFVLSRIDSTEIVDFRLNEVRDLPGIIQTKDLSNSALENIHFFLIRGVDSEFKQAHENFKRCRLLEKGLWNDYLNPEGGGRTIPPTHMLIYHWKDSDSNGIEKFTAFAKFSKIIVTKFTFYAFILIALLMGTVSGAFGNIFYGYLSDLYHWVVPLLKYLYQVHF